MSDLYIVARENLKFGDESSKAASYWANLESYHFSNDDDPIAVARSRWIAEEILGSSTQLQSVLEIGCNSGRNLFHIQQSHPEARLKGLDINADALVFARETKPGIDFELIEPGLWSENAEAWDFGLTMSVLDHIPYESAKALVANISNSCRAVIGVEMWDGEPGSRGLYKYSINLSELYESVGFKTQRWEPVPVEFQYDQKQSFLWLYVGAR